MPASPASTSTSAPAEDLSGLHELGRQPPLRDYVRELVSRREFLLTVPLSNLRAQNQSTVLGNLWHLLNPLLLAGVFYLIFGVILDARGGIDNYPAFLVTGIFTFYFTQKSMLAGTRTVVANMDLIRSIAFPRALLPMSSVVTETLAQLPALMAMFVIVLLTGERPSLAWLLTLPVLLVQAVFNLGLAFVAARLTFHFRDTAQFLPYALRIWLYLSGVFFAASRVPEGWPRTLFTLNPMYNLIHLNRLALLPGTTEARAWAIALVAAATVGVGGFLFFRAREIEYGRG